MKHLARLVLVAAGTALAINGLFVAGISNFNIGYLLAIGIGAVLFLYGVFFSKINRATAKRWEMAALPGLCRFSLPVWRRRLSGRLWPEGQCYLCGRRFDRSRRRHPRRAGQPDFGQRLEAAIAYYERNPKVLLVVSGGQGPQEDISEALAMERYLIERGIPRADHKRRKGRQHL